MKHRMMRFYSRSMLDVMKEKVPARGESFIDRNAAFVVAAIALAVAACMWPLRMHFPFDDTFITFRYSQNVAHGYGIVWNHGGAHTEGYTNFLYMLLLAPFSAMGVDLALAAQIIGVMAVVVSAVVIYRIVENGEWRMENGAALVPLLAVLLFLLDPFTWMNAYSGMETSLFTMWIVLAVWAGSGQRGLSGAAPWIFAMLAALTRPEGALMGAILLGVALLQPKATRHSSFVIRNCILFFVVPLLVYAAWKLWYFGDLLPNSFYVKVAHAGGTEGHPFHGWRLVLGFIEAKWYLITVVLIGLWQLRKQGGWYSRLPMAARVALLWCALVLTFYVFARPIMDFYDRFTNSAEVIIIVLAMMMLPLMTSMRRRMIIFAAQLVILHIGWAFAVRGAWGDLTRGTEYEDTYRRVAPVFASIPHHEDITIATADAGILPYYSGMKCLDMVGLNDNDIAHCKTSDEVIATIIRKQPDIILLPLEKKSGPYCRKIFNEGHGLIGSAYGKLDTIAEANGYSREATLVQTVYDFVILVNGRFDRQTGRFVPPHMMDIVHMLWLDNGKEFGSAPTCLE